MRIQINLEPITTSYQTFPKLAIIIYFAIIIIMSRMRDENRMTSSTVPTSAPCSLDCICAHAAEVLQILFCALVSDFYVHRLRD